MLIIASAGNEQEWTFCKTRGTCAWEQLREAGLGFKAADTADAGHCGSHETGGTKTSNDLAFNLLSNSPGFC